MKIKTVYHRRHEQAVLLDDISTTLFFEMMPVVPITNIVSIGVL